MIYGTFAQRLRTRREAAGLSVYNLAARAGLSFQAVYRYEAGKRAPTWEAVQKLATALGVSTEQLRPD